LAEIADAMARTAEASAHVHDQMAERLPAAAEHAARDRLLGAAERKAAEAFRAGELPSQAVRQAIRASGSSADVQAYAEQRTIDLEQRDIELGLRAMALDDRERRLAERERGLDDREAHRSDRPDERDRRAGTRDQAADQHEKQADERGRRADHRDATSTETPPAVDEREDAADQGEIDLETERAEPPR